MCIEAVRRVAWRLVENRRRHPPILVSVMHQSNTRIFQYKIRHQGRPVAGQYRIGETADFEAHGPAHCAGDRSGKAQIAVAAMRAQGRNAFDLLGAYKQAARGQKQIYHIARKALSTLSTTSGFPTCALFEV
jgi:hypothetical protein